MGDSLRLGWRLPPAASRAAAGGAGHCQLAPAASGGYLTISAWASRRRRTYGAVAAVSGGCVRDFTPTTVYRFSF